MQSQSPDGEAGALQGEQMTFRTYYIRLHYYYFFFFATGKAAGHSYLAPANHTNMSERARFDLI